MDHKGFTGVETCTVILASTILIIGDIAWTEDNENLTHHIFQEILIITRGLGPGGAWGGRAPLELGIYEVKFLKIGKISFFLLHRAPPG